ncbi:hypothetical protein [Lachnoclostridium sp. Marseille-P6806]|uniref:hypothetical protein n=1 Tax=Lachnoclostridium sp. Marseille-P6806 TaxID=2364793 RepID=UPI00356B043B
MGYDVSFHPISPKEMQEWYFAPLAWVQRGQEEKVRAFAAQLLRDLEQNKKVLEDLEELWCDGQLAVLKKALTAAVELGVGLLEATEVVEPNPIAPNESTSYSNLYHCDRDGVYLYIDMAIRQIAQAMGKNTDDR